MDVGDKFPDFKLKNHKNEEISSSELKGKKYLIFAYPRALTPGCTKEACSVRDYYQELTKRGFIPFGISNDTPDKNMKFVEKHNLQYDLLCDEDSILLSKIGAFGEKNIYGKKTTGTFRYTYIIDNEGVLRKIFKKVNTDMHGEELIKAIDELGI
ncbi:MAG: peroxiredoxin [Candidatus Heimdallarchaeota archaeon]|nr:peroxiredoxin [Candidatus Heimdallarchaeota archaeon]MDH5647237.1 peroxiredoxin [Candidatus Heimdallarchaeota archaeon]